MVSGAIEGLLVKAAGAVYYIVECTYLRVFVKVVLKGNGSKGLRPQLVRCAPFPSIAPYFRML
jgi:hypothetical protein